MLHCGRGCGKMRPPQPGHLSISAHGHAAPRSTRGHSPRGRLGGVPGATGGLKQCSTQPARGSRGDLVQHQIRHLRWLCAHRRCLTSSHPPLTLTQTLGPSFPLPHAVPQMCPISACFGPRALRRPGQRRKPPATVAEHRLTLSWGGIS